MNSSIGNRSHRNSHNVIVQPTSRDRPVYTLDLLAPFAGVDSELQSRGHILAAVDAAAIDLRVDWDGDTSSAGTFEVRVGASMWKACDLIDPSDPNDLISPDTELTGERLDVRFVRGPAHGSVPFAIKAIPVVWLQEPTGQIAAGYTAARGTDYEYENNADPQNMPWLYSAAVSGIQHLAIELATKRAYEVWVHLQSPSDPSQWQLQDPIVRTGSDGGNPD